MQLLLTQKRWLIALAVVALFHFLAVPFLSSTFVEIIIFAGINVIMAVSLNLVNGFTGQFSIGHAGFMAVGAYSSAWLSMNLGSQWSIPPAALLVLALILGGVLASAIGYLVGLPSLRLKGDYLAIVTLGFGEIIRVCLLNMDFLGGARGLSGIPLMVNFFWVYMGVIFTIFIITRIVLSSHGRSLLAVREDEIAAESMGVNTTQAKVRAFAVGAFFAGVAGGLYAHYITVLSPPSFDFNRSFEIIIMVVLGGMGSISGSILAAVLLTFLKEYLRDLSAYTVVDLRMIIYSLILIGLMLTRPNGLFGKQELPELIRRWRSKGATR